MCVACADDAELALLCRERLPGALERTYLLRHLSPEQLAGVLETAASVRLTDGQWLYRQGEPAERFFLVRQGQMALFRQSAAGKESIIALVGPDEMFAESLAFLEAPVYDLNARAIGECTLLSFDRRRFRPLVASSPELCLELMETLHRRQQMLLDEIERLTLHDATHRVMAYLLDQVADARGPQRLEISVPRTVLASRLSIQPETLSRILARLKACHYVRDEEGALVVPEPDALRAGLGCTLCSLRSWGCPGPERLRTGSGRPRARTATVTPPRRGPRPGPGFS